MKVVKSPFKFLDSYQQKDHDIFFGREEETENLYDALSGVKHLLVYGPSGAGKTSLIECGLRNQFSDADWFAISIRRNQNMIGSVFSKINESLENEIDLNPNTNLPINESIDFGHAIEALFSEKYQPIYLLFDQFEELLILGTKKEKEDFFSRLNQLIRYKVPCRMILIMREEFIGHLSEFEHLCPSIFQHRFRLEKMGRANVREVILNILEAERYQRDFEVENSKTLSNEILKKLPDEQKEIELTHVQVFLSELWERAYQKKNNQTPPIIKKELIKEEDKLEDVLERFLKKQLKELELLYPKDIPLEVLAEMISKRNTKLQLSYQELKSGLEKNGLTLNFSLTNILKELEERKIIRPLKAGDQTKYEISHDLLALAVGQNRTQKMKMREKAEDIYKVYLERKGFYSKDDLDFIRPYQQHKPYPKELKNRINESENHLEESQQKELSLAQARSRRLTSLLSLAIVALIAAAYFGWDANTQKQDAINSKRSAQDRLIKAHKSEKKRFESEREKAKSKIISFGIYGAKDDVKNIEKQKIDILNFRIDSLSKEIKKLER